jgi:hypothetical protein
MKADDILSASVLAMKSLLGPDSVTEAIKRARGRDEETNGALLDTYRVQINDVVLSIRETGDPHGIIHEISIDLKDALVIRYLKNREMFMQTFPNGIEGIDPDPASIWAAIMISPQDEAESSG